MENQSFPLQNPVPGRPMLPSAWVKISPHLGGKVGLPGVVAPFMGLVFCADRQGASHESANYKLSGHTRQRRARPDRTPKLTSELYKLN
jgi:hypothetical protein